MLRQRILHLVITQEIGILRVCATIFYYHVFLNVNSEMHSWIILCVELTVDQLLN